MINFEAGAEKWVLSVNETKNKRSKIMSHYSSMGIGGGDQNSISVCALLEIILQS